MRRRLVIGLICASAAIFIAVVAAGAIGGLRLNLTPSEALGLWRIEALERPVAAGDLVFICPPPSEPFEIARDRAASAREASRRSSRRWPRFPASASRSAQASSSTAGQSTNPASGPSMARAGRSALSSAVSCLPTTCSFTHPWRAPMTPATWGRSRLPALSALHGRFSPSIRDRWRAALLILFAVAVGTLGWSGEVLLLPLAMIFPAIWAHSPSRLVADMVSAGYFLAASRGQPQGVPNFYAADLWPGLLLWLGASASFVGVHAALWARRPGKGRAARYLAAAALMVLPPLGITGWAHPLTAAGMLFPGWGWWGIGATAILSVLMTGRRWQIAVAVLGGLCAWSATNWTPPKLPDAWRGVDLALGQNLGRDGSLDHHRDLIATVRRRAGEGGRVIVLPESALGFWTPTVARLWQDGLRDLGVTVVAGAAVIDASGYDNVMVAISSAEANILYSERMPVPVSMWQPWRAWTGRGGGARAHLFANPVVELDGMRIAPLICYEQLILWPALQSMLHSPDLIVATGNGWWTAGTSIVAIQQASAVAWAKLFGVPIVMAFNM